VVAVVEVVTSVNKDSRHALRSFVEKTANLLYNNINVMLIAPFSPRPRDPQDIHKVLWDEIADGPFVLPAPIKTANVEPIAGGQAVPDMPLLTTRRLLSLDAAELSCTP
jgi:hypothetical protein